MSDDSRGSVEAGRVSQNVERKTWPFEVKTLVYVVCTLIVDQFLEEGVGK